MTDTKTTLLIAAHTAALPDEGNAPEWVHLLPAGQFSGRDQRGPWLFGAAESAQVIAEFEARKMPLAIDYEHQSLKVDENGKPAPAAGWITALESRENGLWGKVEWTAAAADYIAHREYRYLSPVFLFEQKSSRVVALTGCGLTNEPNLFLTAINRAATTLESHTSKGIMMEDILERLRYLFNLPTLAGEAEITAELEKLKTRLAAPETAAMRQRLNLAADAGFSDLLEAAMQTEAAPDPAAYIPKADHDKIAAELAAMKAEQAEAQVETAVNAALSAQKIVPAQVEKAKELYRQSPGAFEDFISASPLALAANTAALAGGKPAAPAAHPLIADAQKRIGV